MLHDVDRAIEWMNLNEVPALVERATGWKPSNMTVYTWVKKGHLKSNGYRPLRTTRRWVQDYIDTYRKATFR